MTETFKDSDRSLIFFAFRALWVMSAGVLILMVSAVIPIAICYALALFFDSMGITIYYVIILLGFPFTALAALRGLWFLGFRKPKPELGVLLSLEDEVYLRDFLVEICSVLKSKLPDAIVLHSEPKIAVFQGQVRCLNGKRRGRMLVIGLPILQGMEPGQLRAVLAHEFAHFTGSDTLYSAFVAPVYRGLNFTLTRMSTLSTKEMVEKPGLRRWIAESFFMFFKLPSALPVPALGYVFRRFYAREQKHSWDREFRADRIACDVCGPQQFRTALLRAIAIMRAFDSYVRNLEDVEDSSPRDFYRSLRHDLGDADVETTEEPNSEHADTYLSHPPPAARLERVALFSTVAPQRFAFKAEPRLIGEEDYEDLLSSTYKKALLIHPSAGGDPRPLITEEQAGILRRIAAGIIDTFVIAAFFFVAYPLTKPVGEAFIDPYMPHSMALFASHGNLFLIELFLIPWLYFSLTESSWMRASLGKRILDISVCDLGSNRVSFGRASARFFLGIVQPFYGLLNVLTSKHKQALSDLWPGTKVIVGQQPLEKRWSWKLGKLFVFWLIFGTVLSLAVHVGPPNVQDPAERFEWESELGYRLDSLDVIGLAKAKVYSGLGQWRLSANRADLAISDFQVAARARPDLPELKLYIGESYYRMKRYEDANLAFISAENPILDTPPDLSAMPWGHPDVVERLLSSKVGETIVHILQNTFDPKRLNETDTARLRDDQIDNYIGSKDYNSALAFLHYAVMIQPGRQDLRTKLCNTLYAAAERDIDQEEYVEAIGDYSELKRTGCSAALQVSSQIKAQTCNRKDKLSKMNCEDLQKW